MNIFVLDQNRRAVPNMGAGEAGERDCQDYEYFALRRAYICKNCHGHEHLLYGGLMCSNFEEGNGRVLLSKRNPCVLCFCVFERKPSAELVPFI